MVTFSASARSVSPSRVDVDVRQFSFVIDEPPTLGGTDDGPNPVEVVLSALLGCMNVVVRLVAKEYDVEVHSLELYAEGDLDPAKLFGQDVDTRAGFSGIRLHLAIDADACEDEIHQIVEESKRRCPVGDNLLSETPLTVAFDSMAELAAA
jgi:uncharacterized OsmC-like protein